MPNPLRALSLAAFSLILLGQASPADDGEQPSAAKKPKHTNRLAKETSPYLLLHAHNPVDWYPWGLEALAKAKKEKKLIFLSVGYSSCYWCHVMERESFMDEEIAKFLNEHFVCVKVDREERPDIDEIYMTSLQVYNQLVGSPAGGGWPMSMFLTPDAKPIGGGTYFPPRTNKERGLMGFIDVLKQISGSWEKDPENVAKQAAFITERVRLQMRNRPPLAAGPLGASTLDDLQAALAEDFDPKYGGFRYSEDNPRIPKFPEPSNLEFLIDRVRRSGDPQAKKMLLATLEHMASGGIRDHLGGGFHRYSTDRYWRIPHFEKMLYDNAQLASVYAEAYGLTKREEFRRVVDELLQFVLRELTAEHGGFYSALDAETDGEEGRYYVWETEELKQILSQEEFKLFADVYGVSEGPNFEGRHALLLPRPLEESAKQLKLSPKQLEMKLEPIRKKLLAVRGKRKRPLRDTKILTSWNGLMIRGFADSGRILKEDRYIKAAAAAADFALNKLRGEDGRLKRTYAGGQAKLNAYLDDYAFLIDGLIALHRASGDRRWLDAAGGMMEKQIELFADENGGGFYFTSADHEALIARSHGPMDGARPSGNSVSAANLLYLAKTLNKPEYRKLANKTVQARAAVFSQAPSALPRMAIALAKLLDEKPGPAGGKAKP